MSMKNEECHVEDCHEENCGECKNDPKNFLEETNELSEIKKVIGIVSGKGGVGKSLVTAMLAILLSRKGLKTGILDADITGPSIPKMFGIANKAKASEMGLFPERTRNDIRIMSINLLLQNADDPVIWRGPILSGTVKQFWTDVIWGDLDVLFIDMPPGTGDVPLTVFQSIPLDGIIVVTSPQELVSLIVKKACNMAKQMNIPVLGIVENMSYVKCPGCGREIKLFGESSLPETAKSLGVDILGRIPVDPVMAGLVDRGEFERFNNNYLNGAAEKIMKTIE
jgi:Mrp family chromosome partitioning ATPase